MKNKSQKYLENTISKRFFLLSILKGAVVGGIGWRFFDLQMIEHRKYEKLSDNNQFNFHMIAPERGRILDRKMRLLAGNMDGFSLVLKWNKNINVDDIIEHNRFGVGKVMSSLGTGENKRVDVLFADGTKKRLVVKYANLTKLF